jgi:hypothetical protein
MLNISTVTFVWITKPPHPPKPGTHLLSDELGIDGVDKTKVDAIEKEHHIEKHKLMDKDVELHKKLYEAIGGETDVTFLQNEISDNKRKIETMTFNFFDTIAKYCDEAQVLKLKDFVHSAFEEIRPMHPPKK